MILKENKQKQDNSNVYEFVSKIEGIITDFKQSNMGFTFKSPSVSSNELKDRNKSKWSFKKIPKSRSKVCSTDLNPKYKSLTKKSGITYKKGCETNQNGAKSQNKSKRRVTFKEEEDESRRHKRKVVDERNQVRYSICFSVNEDY